MPRQARIDLPGFPVHAVQRGVNRGAVFVDDADRRHFLALMGKSCREHGIALHAYVLMSNHVHMLATASAAGAMSAWMHGLNLCYAQWFNRRHERTGPLWESRFKSCLVDSDAYVLTVHRYIELNPVRAGLCDRPDAYRWSSARGNLGLRQDALLTQHPTLHHLADDPASTFARYGEWLSMPLPPGDIDRIRTSTRQGRAFGDLRFEAMLERTLGRPIRCRPAGRPFSTLAVAE